MLKPYPFQETAIAMGSKTHTLIGDKCGLGKTLDALEVIRRSWRAPDDELWMHCPALVICPKQLRSQWLEKAAEQGIKAVIHGEWFDGVHVLVVTHYEALQNIRTRTELRGRNWSVMVIDEAHRIKNRNAQRTKFVKEVGRHAYRRLCLTGTPMEKSAGDLWSIFNFLYPDSYRSYWKFEDRFVDKRLNYAGFPEIVGSKNLEVLGEETRDFFIRRGREVVNDQLPPITETIVELDMEDNQRTLYDIIKKADDIEVTVSEDLDPIIIQNALVKITRLQQATSYPPMLTLNSEAGSKVQWVREFVEDNPDEPIVIFTRFRETASVLAGVLNAQLIMGGSPPTGGTPLRRVGTIAAMGEGLSFGEVTTAIFVDYEWSTILMSQAKDRIDRVDSPIHLSKQIIYLHCKRSVDRLFHDRLTKKWSDAKTVYEYLANRKEM